MKTSPDYAFHNFGLKDENTQARPHLEATKADFLALLAIPRLPIARLLQTDGLKTTLERRSGASMHNRLADDDQRVDVECSLREVYELGPDAHLVHTYPVTLDTHDATKSHFFPDRGQWHVRGIALRDGDAQALLQTSQPRHLETSPGDVSGLPFAFQPVELDLTPNASPDQAWHRLQNSLGPAYAFAGQRLGSTLLQCTKEEPYQVELAIYRVAEGPLVGHIQHHPRAPGLASYCYVKRANTLTELRPFMEAAKTCKTAQSISARFVQSLELDAA